MSWKCRQEPVNEPTISRPSIDTWNEQMFAMSGIATLSSLWRLRFVCADARGRCFRHVHDVMVTSLLRRLRVSSCTHPARRAPPCKRPTTGALISSVHGWRVHVCERAASMLAMHVHALAGWPPPPPPASVRATSEARARAGIDLTTRQWQARSGCGGRVGAGDEGQVSGGADERRSVARSGRDFDASERTQCSAVGDTGSCMSASVAGLDSLARSTLSAATCQEQSTRAAHNSLHNRLQRYSIDTTVISMLSFSVDIQARVVVVIRIILWLAARLSRERF